MKTVIFTENAPTPIGPYSQAIKVGQTLYVSGQIGINPADGKVVDESIESETRQVMLNIEAILAEAGASFDNVIKCSIFVSDMKNFAAINGIYGEFFKQNPPARETVEVSALPKYVNVEISCIAVLT